MSKPLGLALAAALLAPASVIAAPPPTVVFFTEWSARIDDAARRAIDAAAERAKQDGAKELTVTGYADTTGSKEANALLSATRAQVVTDQLVADGVPASHIHQAAKGATDFIQTSLESRRVVISIAEP
jgi:outer membrane protein OmpA-like peptidoglycan-associated protein